MRGWLRVCRSAGVAGRLLGDDSGQVSAGDGAATPRRPGVRRPARLGLLRRQRSTGDADVSRQTGDTDQRQVRRAVDQSLQTGPSYI